MKREIIIVALIVLVVFAVFYFLSDAADNSDISKNITTVDVPLDTVAIHSEDIPDYFEFIAEKHWTDPGNFTNSTGNRLVWNYVEHYQSNYIENNSDNQASAQNDVSSKIIQSVTKLESEEKAELYVELWNEKRENNKDYTKIQIDTIGSKSAYYSFTLSYREYEIDNYVLVFSIGDVVVTIGGGGLSVDQDTYYNFAKTIENNIINSVNC